MLQILTWFSYDRTLWAKVARFEQNPTKKQTTLLKARLPKGGLRNG